MRGMRPTSVSFQGPPWGTISLSARWLNHPSLTVPSPWAVVEIANDWIKKAEPGPFHLRKVPKKRVGEELGRDCEEQKGTVGGTEIRSLGRGC